MRCLRWLMAALALAWLAGCASPPPAAPGEQVFSGRLALTIEGRQDQSFSAGFDLRGAAAAGELTLRNPLGGVVAVLQWAPGGATLQTGGQTRQFASLDALAQEATGTTLPVAALFDWLRGEATQAAGWSPDVSQVAEGRVRAQRLVPAPAADLRIALDR